MNLRSFLFCLLCTAYACIVCQYDATALAIDEPTGTVVAVPITPNLTLSTQYTATAGGVPLAVAHEVSADAAFETTAFTLAGEAEIVITAQSAIQSYSVHPLSKGIEAAAEESTLRFRVTEPMNLLVRINDDTPLLLFITPSEENIPDPNDPDVLYFAPGEHRVGRMRLHDNQTVYIAGGAIVYGTLEGEGVENIKIRGRGCLDGSKDTSWEDRIFGIYFDRSRNIDIEGIAIRNNYWWVTHFLLCTDVRISHINLFSFYRNNGGLMVDGCTNYTASNSFILTNDDCICPHALNAAGNGEPIAQNYLFKNLVLYNVETGNGIRIGASFETSLCQDWVFEDIDILAHTTGSAVMSDFSDWALVRNLWFINLTDEQAENKTLDFFIDSTRYSNFNGYRNQRGNMDGIYFVNLQTPGGGFHFKGYDEQHLIKNVHFYNCRVGENLINGPEDIVTNEYVTDLHFPNKRPVYQPGKAVATDKPAGSSAPEVILDDGSTGVRFAGFDRVDDQAQFHNNNLRVTEVPQGFSNFKAAIYEPQLEGRYSVAVSGAPVADGTSSARWVINHRKGFTIKYLNQQAESGWQKLGTFDLTPSSYVRLSLPGYFQVADGKTVADAVKFTRIKSN